MSTMNVTRRGFITAAASSAAVAASNLVGTAGAEQISAAAYDWETPPAPIDEALISATVEADVLIVGAGTSGLCCGLKAAEEGASVVMIDKMPMVIGRGGSMFAMNSRFCKEKGIELNIGQVYKRMMGYHSFRVDQDKWLLHFNRSGEAMDWLEERMATASTVGGNDLFPILEEQYDDPEDLVGEYQGTHEFLGGPNGSCPRDNPAQDVVDNLAAWCVAKGVDIHYNTRAEQLIKDEDGRVIGCIAVDEDDNYIKFLGKNGVVMATGDFGTNKEMIAKYCPWALQLGDGGVFDGYGHKMAMWAGAAWQKNEQAVPLLMCFQWINITNQVRSFQGLLVNDNGVRYTNEDNVLSHGTAAFLSQPNSRAYAIWDTAYAYDADWRNQYKDGPRVFPTGEDAIAHWDNLVSAGTIDQNGSGPLSMNMIKCDTLEELIEQLGLPMEATMATIERYNGFCETGVDEDYHKREGLLFPVKEGPFYAAMCTPWQLAMLGGIRCTTEMEAQDENDQVIPGLYVLGSMVGDMYCNIYSTHFPGHNLGSTCLTFGYLTGNKLAHIND